MMKIRPFIIGSFLQLLVLGAWAQARDITGVWKGTVVTPELKLPYELIFVMENGKLSGFSHTIFMVSGVEMVAVKRLKIQLKNDQYIIEDDDLLFDNFNQEAPRKIKQTNKLSLETAGKQWRLYGTFESRAPRMLKPAAGTVDLERQPDLTDTRLFAKLKELNLAGSIAAVQNPTSPVIAKVDKQISPPAPEPVSTVIATPIIPKATTAITPDSITQPVAPIIAVVTPAEVIAIPLEKRFYTRRGTVGKVIPPISRPQRTMAEPVTTSARIAKLDVIIVANEPVVAKVPAAPSSVGRPSQPTSPATKPAIAIAKPAVPKPAAPKPTAPVAAVVIPKKVPVNVTVGPVVDLAKRQIETIQQLYIESDSLQFTLYDNGEVDGDTVSVIMNGKTIVSRQGLNTTAFTKTVYMTPDLGDSVQLVMYAENLGSLAPNTGLLVLLYDNKRQEIRFSGDLNKNAAITLRRRQKP